MCQRPELDELAEKYKQDPALSHMHDTHINYVPGRGSFLPRVFMVGEAPGKFENFYVQPFVGPAGKLLEDMMAVAGLDESNTYITNVVKFRPINEDGNNRTPTYEEIVVSIEYLHEEKFYLGLPKIIVPIGVIATRVYIPGVKSIFKVAGMQHSWNDCTVIPMVHPAYILRNPHQRPTFEEHWKWLGGAIE